MFNFFKSKINKTQLPDNFDINQINSQYIQTLKEQINNLTLKEIQEKDFIDFTIINLLSKELIEDIKKFKYDYTNANNPCLHEDRDMFEFHIFLYMKIQSYLLDFFWINKINSQIIFNYIHYYKKFETTINIFELFKMFKLIRFHHFLKTLNDVDFIYFFNLLKKDSYSDRLPYFTFYVLKHRDNLINETLCELPKIYYLSKKDIDCFVKLFIKKDLFNYSGVFKNNPELYLSLEKHKTEHMLSNF